MTAVSMLNGMENLCNNIVNLWVYTGSEWSNPHELAVEYRRKNIDSGSR